MYDLAKQPAKGIEHVFRAFQLYDDEDRRLRALHDIGMMLKALGDYSAANDAFEAVDRRGTSIESRANALIELMDSASIIGDRFSFERYGGSCDEIERLMPPNMLADLYGKRALGLARFGYVDDALHLCEDALAIAEQHGLNAEVFALEQLRETLPRAHTEAAGVPADTASPDWRATRGVAASLRRLATSVSD